MISGYVTAFVAQRYAILRSQRNRFQKSIVAQIRIVSSVARNMAPDTRAHHADGCSRSINSVRGYYKPHTDVFLCSRSTQFQPAQTKKLCIRTSRCVARAACMRGRPDCAHASADGAVRVQHRRCQHQNPAPDSWWCGCFFRYGSRSGSIVSPEKPISPILISRNGVIIKCKLWGF